MKLRSAVKFVFIAILVAACSAAPEPRPMRPRRLAGPRPADVYGDWQRRPSATPSATPGMIGETLEEGPADRGIVIPEDAAIEERTPIAEQQAEPDDTPEPEPEIVASIPKSESLLPRLAPGLPPNQAAAIRVIEEGRKLIDANQYDQATDRLERGVSIDPANPYGYYYLARVKYLKKEYSQAVAFAGRAVALSARTDRKWVSRAYTLQAEIFEEVGRYRDARTSYGKAMQADPSNLSARVGSARLAPVHDNPGTE